MIASHINNIKQIINSTIPHAFFSINYYVLSIQFIHINGILKTASKQGLNLQQVERRISIFRLIKIYGILNFNRRPQSFLSNIKYKFYGFRQWSIIIFQDICKVQYSRTISIQSGPDPVIFRIIY